VFPVHVLSIEFGRIFLVNSQAKSAEGFGVETCNKGTVIYPISNAPVGVRIRLGPTQGRGLLLDTVDVLLRRDTQ
jgi:hypothetical protein